MTLLLDLYSNTNIFFNAGQKRKGEKCTLKKQYQRPTQKCVAGSWNKPSNGDIVHNTGKTYRDQAI